MNKINRKLIIVLLCFSFAGAQAQQKPSLKELEQKAIGRLEERRAQEREWAAVRKVVPTIAGDSLVCPSGFRRGAARLVGRRQLPYSNMDQREWESAHDFVQDLDGEFENQIRARENLRHERKQLERSIAMAPNRSMTSTPNYRDPRYQGEDVRDLLARMPEVITPDRLYRLEGASLSTRAYVFKNDSRINDLKMIGNWNSLGSWIPMKAGESAVATRAFAASRVLERTDSRVKFELPTADGSMELFFSAGANNPPLYDLSGCMPMTISYGEEDIRSKGCVTVAGSETYACTEGGLQAWLVIDQFEKTIVNQYGATEKISPYVVLLITDVPFSNQ